MPVIVLASPKGGAGKTTTSVVLACALARGSSVTLIDADDNHPLKVWNERPGRPESLDVLFEHDEHSIIDTIDDATERSAFVIIDTKGSADLLVPYAISRADLVLIPTQGSQLDAAQAARALRVIKTQEKALKRPIPHAIILTRTSTAIRSRGLRNIEEQLHQHGISLLRTNLIEREAYRALFSFGGCLENLSPKDVFNVDAAIQNATALAAEVVEILRDLRDSANNQAVA